jgi:flagellar hook-associated protein 2
MEFSVNSASTGGSQALGSPLDVQWIVEQLIYGKQQPIRDLETYQIFYEAKKTAFQDLNTKISSLEDSLYTLNTGGFDSKTAQLSSDDYLSASTSSTAESGDYYIKVRQLATAQSDSSTLAGVTDPDAYVLTDGETFTLEQDGNSVDIDITGNTRTLNGLKNAINSSDLDVTATIINDGTDYHLQVTADETGTDNAITITDTNVGTSMSTKITALDALFNVNTLDASDAITRGTNNISDVIQGVTLNLIQADADKTTVLSIGNDTSNLKENVQDFVDKYNDLKDFLNKHFEYNSAEGKSGVLSGESTARKVQSDILLAVSSRVEGLDSDAKYTGLYSIGVELTNDGSLELDESKFNGAVEDDLEAVKRIFKNVGSSDNSDIQYIAKDNNTAAGRYEVIITNVAEEASVEGQNDIGTLAVAETLTVNYNDTDYDFSLTSGMDIDAVISAINTEVEEENLGFYATDNGDRLVFSSELSGSSQTLNVSSTGSGAGFGTARSNTGQDVAGTIGGNTATGEGSVLTGSTGDSKGLMVYVSASTTGNKGDVYVTFGVGEKLREIAEELSFPQTGLIAKNIESFDDRLETISDQIKDINRQLAKEQEILIDQFTRANQALVELQYLQSSLNNNLKT